MRRIGLPDDGAAITVPRASSLEVVLPQSASTGYRWEIAPSEGLSVVDDRLEPPPSDRPGASGQRIFVLRVDESGVVSARLRRVWEPPEAAGQAYSVRVRTA
jgi:predicted secreted protein